MDFSKLRRQQEIGSVYVILAFVVTERTHDGDEIIKMIKDRQNQLQIILDIF